MRYIYFVLFFILSATCIFGQVPAKKNLSIIDFEQLVKYYRYYKQDSAIYFAQKGIDFARQSGDSNGVALMLIQAGMIDDNLGEFENSLNKYNRALEIFKILDSKKNIATATIRIGVVELRNGKFDNAVKYFFDALRISEQSGDGFGVMEANYSISWAYLDQHNYKMALQYLKIAEQQNNNLPFSNISLNIFNHLGVVYRETGEFKQAMYYLEKGVQFSNNKPEYQGLNITIINNLASVYSKVGLKEKAITIQKDALNRSREMGNYLRTLQVLYGLSRTYGKENTREAIFYLQQAISLAKEKGAYNQEIRYLRAITPFYVADKNYEQAYLMKEREKTLADSFLYKSMSQNMASLKAEYELSKSNARIKELDLLNNKRKLELRNASTLRYVTFGGIALLIIILSLLYNQYRIKQRSNKEISLKNHSLERLLEEKEWLLKEVHHRVKNNLHTVMSLLETQSTYLKDDALLAIQNSQHRVYAMSLIHQKLYQLDNSANINMAVYLPELIHYLRDSFDVPPHILTHVEIENIYLDISQAIPVGLIINEAITNSFKYAFPFNNSGEVNVRMIKTPGQVIRLSVSDNGIGFSLDCEKNHSNSLGLKLMKGLSEDIHAKFSIENFNGTNVIIEFPEDHILKSTRSKESIKIMEFQS